MNRYKNSPASKYLFRILVTLFSTVILASVVYVLLFVYKPAQNSFEALASVSMDSICILVLIMMVVNFTFAKGEMSRTTGLFLALIISTMGALLMDFLTWVSDGSLAYDNINYSFIVLSLCSGCVLAGIFVFYLSSYMVDMYGMKSSFLSAKICLGLNIAAFILTNILAFTHTAFVIEDGHYRLGSLYDVVTIIPIITVLYMAGYSIYRVKTIGVHDMFAVIGFNLTMIVGAIIEAIFGIGTTYVFISLADILIFIMLQNKLLDRYMKQHEALSSRITSQYEILKSMAGIYSHVNYVDLDAHNVKRFDINADFDEVIPISDTNHTDLNKSLYDGIIDEHKENFWEFTDLDTLPDRIAGEKVISSEFRHSKDGWFRSQYIRIGETNDRSLTKFIYTIRNVDEDKKNVEKWIKKSNTDELTGFFNRHAFEDEISALENSEIPEKFAYISIDLNSLKIANDTLGHDAGDELIIGAGRCMKQCLGSYGKLFRTGGDEFIAILRISEEQLKEVIKDFNEVSESWHGKLNKQLTMSCGYVSGKEAAGMNIHQVGVLADKRMYEDKAQYYQRKGVDRRGQRDAHVALQSLYTKILKANITEDTYQIVNMSNDEKDPSRGYDESLTKWLTGFGTSGQVHPDDLENYLANVNTERISTYFKENTEPLKLFYRRRCSDGYEKVMLEMIRANDYSDDFQTLFMYVISLQ